MPVCCGESYRGDVAYTYLLFSASLFFPPPICFPNCLNTKLVAFLLLEFECNIGLEDFSLILYYKSLVGFHRTETKIAFVRSRTFLCGYILV